MVENVAPVASAFDLDVVVAGAELRAGERDGPEVGLEPDACAVLLDWATGAGPWLAKALEEGLMPVSATVEQIRITVHDRSVGL